METIIVSANDIRLIVQQMGIDALMDEMIQRLTGAFLTYEPNDTIIPARAGFQYIRPDSGLLEWMPSMQVGQAVTVKMVGYHPTNPLKRNLPTILSTTSIYDTASGHLVGLVDSTFLTALRTGAASAIASKQMAAPHSTVIGLIGAGAQAVTQLHALSRVFDIKKVLVFDSDPAISDSFLARTSFLGLNVCQVKEGSLSDLVQGSDIICTATSIDVGIGPVFEDTATQPWVHINAVGSDFPGKTELPKSLLQRSFVCPDFPEQAIKEGECQQLSPAEIGPSLVELIRNREKYALVTNIPTVFDSTGWALEDKVAAEMIIEFAAQFNLGTILQIESISTDSHNPYQFALEKSFAIPISEFAQRENREA
jgi:ornithine cyclodeaminase/alanine dehydrogenase-like protein (mu-crystallin family)